MSDWWWDESNVTHMDNSAFAGCSQFNEEDISKWNVSNVTNMENMFRCSRLNQPLNQWNVSKVTSIYRMFGDSRCFNQPLNDWDVSRVTYMRYILCSWMQRHLIKRFMTGMSVVCPIWEAWWRELRVSHVMSCRRYLTSEGPDWACFAISQLYYNDVHLIIVWWYITW